MLKNMKKVELHLHLDGSVRLETISELSGKTIEDVRCSCSVSKNCKDLNEYLEKFDLPLEYMQTKENLTRIAKELIEDLEKDSVIYAEIRFAPVLHTKKGLSLEEVVEAVLAGMTSNKVQSNLILCMMRGYSSSENKKIIELAKKYLNHGVVAVDLAGAEAIYPNEEYSSLFEILKEEGIPFTIHAGEASGKESIYSAIEMGTKRIGHGIHIENDLELIELIKKNNILLEICPTSNIQTQAVFSIEEHPIFSLYKSGVAISINTDNRTVSNITLTSEFELLEKTFGFSKEDFKNIQRMAIKHAFLKEEEKQELLNKLLYENM